MCTWARHCNTLVTIRLPPHTPFLSALSLPSSPVLSSNITCLASSFQHTSSLLPPGHQEIIFEPFLYFCFTFSIIISVSYRPSYFFKKKKIRFFAINKNILTWSLIKDHSSQPFIHNIQHFLAFYSHLLRVQRGLKWPLYTELQLCSRWKLFQKFLFS